MSAAANLYDLNLAAASMALGAPVREPGCQKLPAAHAREGGIAEPTEVPKEKR